MAKKLNSIPIDDLNDEITARARLMADDTIKSLTMPRSFFRHQLSRISVPAEVDPVSITHQSHAESCDINHIIRQYDRTGVLPPPKLAGQYADVTMLNDYYANLINDSREAVATYQAELAQSMLPPEPSDPEVTPSAPIPPTSIPPGQTPAPTA